MVEDSVVSDRTDSGEAAWRETVERHVRAGNDRADPSIHLEASRAEFGQPSPSTSSGSLFLRAVQALIVVSIPLLVYSEFLVPGGTINYAGVGIGLVLMIAGGFVYQRPSTNHRT